MPHAAPASQAVVDPLRRLPQRSLAWGGLLAWLLLASSWASGQAPQQTETAETLEHARVTAAPSDAPRSPAGARSDADAPSPADAPAESGTEVRDGVRLVQDLRYKPSEGKSGLCDVYLPVAEASAAGYPVVIAIHGGGWMAGDKWTMAGYCHNLARAGFVAVDINYRLAPEHKFPAQADDVRDALLWIVTQQDRFDLNLDALGLFGYSAGGHLAALVGLLGDAPPEQRQSTSDWPMDDPRWESLPKIDAICVGGPPCDFRPLPQDNTALAYFLGGSRRERPETYDAASPTAHVSANDPPVQIIHGDRDLIVPIGGSQAMHEALCRAGVDSRLETIDGQGHMLTFLHPKTNQLVVEFFEDTLREPRSGSDAAERQRESQTADDAAPAS